MSAHGRFGARRLPAYDLVLKFGEACSNLSHRYEAKRRVDDRAWEQRLPGTQRDGAKLHEHLVEQAVVVKLPNQLAPAYQPHVFPVGRSCHLCVNGSDVATHEMEICAG